MEQVKIAKEFDWEMSHRLTFHKGLCKNIHGHSYKIRIELTGNPDENLMVLDYYDIGRIVKPLLEQLDHAFVCDSKDDLMINFLKENNFKYYIIDGFTTAENLAAFFMKVYKPDFAKYKNIKKLAIRVYETIDAYAAVEETINH